jgi:thiol-disulfide isomerase/thioredoxin
MKNLAKNLALFIFLTIVFSALTGCGGSSSGNGGTPTTNSANGGAAETKKSEYPPVPAAILQAENKGLDGAKIKLEDYKGKVVIVNLWATWCGPCREEMPHLVELQNKHKDKGFEIIGLSIEENDTEEMIKNFAKEMNLNYTLGWIDEKTVDEFIRLSRQNGIPQSFLINRNGELAGIFFGANAGTIAKLKDFTGKAVNEQ